MCQPLELGRILLEICSHGCKFYIGNFYNLYFPTTIESVSYFFPKNMFVINKSRSQSLSQSSLTINGIDSYYGISLIHHVDYGNLLYLMINESIMHISSDVKICESKLDPN